MTAVRRAAKARVRRVDVEVAHEPVRELLRGGPDRLHWRRHGLAAGLPHGPRLALRVLHLPAGGSGGTQAADTGSNTCRVRFAVLTVQFAP